MRDILEIRAKTEGIKITQDAISKLAEIGTSTSLRYAIQLITPANVLSGIDGREEVGLDDVDEVCSLFYDAKASAGLLKASKKMLF